MTAVIVHGADRPLKKPFEFKSCLYKTKERDKTNKMNPSQLEKNSRRSLSILKGPKSRNPLESLESAASSTETTPSRLKRRVSFAEKKHVKEFCDSMEQGTVWDNTYEESDSSHMARSHHDENHQPPIHPAPPPFPLPSLSDSDSSLIFEHPKTPVLDLNFVGPHGIEQHPDLLLEKENIPMNPMASLSEPSDEMIPLPQLSPGIPSSSHKFAIYCDDENSPSSTEKSKNPSADESEDRTLTLTDSQCLDFTEDEPERAEVIPSKLTKPRRSAFDGMEMTEALSSVLSSMEPRDKTKNVTSVLAQKSIWSILHDEEANKVLKPSSRDMEESAGTPSTRKSVLNLDDLRSSILPSSETQEKTQFFHHEVDVTGHIPSVLNPPTTITGVLNSDEMEMTEGITPSFPPTGDNLDESGMELTKAITRLQPINEPEDRTQFFNEVGMEMTEVINRLQPISEPEYQTEFFNQRKMEMTEVINHLQPTSEPEDRTQFFKQGDVEMNEAINPLQPINEPEYRTQFFYQGGMEMTEAINRLQPTSEPEDRTQFFKQGDMEMTEAINSLQPINEPEDRTQFFYQRGMEMTEAINNLQPTNEPEDRNQFFYQGGMEMTEAINRLQPTSEPEDRTQLFYQGGMEMTEVVRPQAQLQNSLMELTEAIPSLKRPYGVISTKDIRDSTTSSPRPKSSKEYASSSKKAPSKQDRDALHRLLHPDSPELSSPNLQNVSMECIAAQSGVQFPKNCGQDLHRLLHSETKSPQFFNQNHHENLTSSCHSTSRQDHAQQNKNNLHHLHEPEGRASSPNLENQSMEFTCRMGPQLDRFVNTRQDDSMEITECRIPVSIRRTRLEDVNMPVEASTPIPIVMSDPSESSGVESSNSFKENRTPPGEQSKMHPVARPLFERQDEEVSDSTPTPLEASEEFADTIRSRPTINGGNLEDVTFELTGAIPKPLEDHGALLSSDLQNIEAPSFMFADSVSDENSLPRIEANRSNEGVSLRDERPKRHVEGELLCQDAEAIRLGDQEITCDFRPVPIPETEFTEEISNFEMRRRTRVLQNNEEEEIARKRRTYNIPEGSTLSTSVASEEELPAVDRRKTHTIRKHEEEEEEVIQRVEKSKTYVITNQSSSKSLEIDGQVRVEMFNKNTVVTYQSKMDDGEGQTGDAGEVEDTVLERRKWFRSDNYHVNVVNDEVNVEFDIRERETTSVPSISRRDAVGEEMDGVSKDKDDTVDKSDPSLEHLSENKGEVEIPEKLSRRAQIVREHDALVRAIKKSRKMEEIMRQKMADMQNKSPESSPEVLAHDSQMEVDKVELSAFESMKQSLEDRASGDCLWVPLTISEDRVFVEFKKTGFTFGATFIVPEDEGGMARINNLYKLTRLAGIEPSILKMTDRLIEDRINTDELKKQFISYDDVLPLIERVTENVRFIYDFYDELKKLYRSNKMEITLERVSFLVMSKSADTILEVSINVKSFNEIGPDDIDVRCFIGSEIRYQESHKECQEKS
ncbi:uncharacterized protein LOC107042860 isoform X2 [Diachasma alloeum]|uniref:uncharacterized protein LOC107042860 isoform X2 n=1 Tax=Diachasma alloeum TaxID=454923 RepID=UPI0007381F95|nr:uncharacterized protein LOC107042860 isoform X2 [Diachasma alloeum]